MKSLEEYTQRVEDWYRKLKPYCDDLAYGWALLSVRFISKEWEDFFLPDLGKEICRVDKCTGAYMLFKPSEYENKLFYIGIQKSKYDEWARLNPERANKVEAWFEENAPGVSPWKEE